MSSTAYVITVIHCWTEAFQFFCLVSELINTCFCCCYCCMWQTYGITDYVEHSFCYEFVSGKRFATLSQNMSNSVTCLQFRKNQDPFMKPSPFPYLELQHIVCPPPFFCLIWIVVCNNGTFCQNSSTFTTN